MNKKTIIIILLASRLTKMVGNKRKQGLFLADIGKK